MKVTLLIFFLLLFPHVINADRQSTRFRLEDEKIGIEEPIQVVEPIEDQVKPEPSDPEFEVTGIKITYGYPFTDESPIANANINNGTIDFEGYDAGESHKETLLTYSAIAPSYAATIYQNHNLSKSSGETLPATSCDDGNCSPSHASQWIKTSAHGLGYNISGNDTPGDFIDKTFFRPLVNENKLPAPIIMQNYSTSGSRTARITLRLVPSGIYPDGSYENTIKITFIPGY